jgi:hypothetical protein
MITDCWGKQKFGTQLNQSIGLGRIFGLGSLYGFFPVIDCAADCFFIKSNKYKILNTIHNQLQSDIPMTVICKMLEIFRDRWSLLIICKLYPCKKTFGELFKSVEEISSNILINRLRRLKKSRYHIKIDLLR